MGGAGKKHSFAGISSRNRKERVSSVPTPSPVPSVVAKPVPKPVVKEEPKQPVPTILAKAGITESTAQAAALIKSKLEGRSEPEPTEREVEKEYPPDTLPKVEVMAVSEDVKKALYGIMNMFDTIYFTVINKGNICSKRVERECLSNCQYYTYCTKKAEIKNTIKVI